MCMKMCRKPCRSLRCSKKKFCTIITILMTITISLMLFTSNNQITFLPWRISKLTRDIQGYDSPPWRQCSNSISDKVTVPLVNPSSSISHNIIARYCEYLGINKIRDIRQLPSKTYSKLSLLESDRDFTLGEEIKVKIHLYDGFGKPLTSGGDILRIWMVEQRVDGTRSNVSGYITDNMDGTYIGSVKACWTGNPTIKISMGNSKEHIGLFLNYVKEFSSYKFTNATFMNSKIKGRESTQCAPYTESVNRRYGGYCNFTKKNYDISYYCGKPKNFSCADWKLFGWDNVLYMDNMTLTVSRDHKYTLLNSISVRIVKGSTTQTVLESPRESCSKLPMEKTWKSTVPSGFLHSNQWYNFICNNTLPRTVQAYRNCLKGRPVTFVGDSTTRHWFVQLTSFLGLNFTSGHFSDIKYKDSNNNPWQKYAHAEDQANGIDIEWLPHEHPFHGTPGSVVANIRSVQYGLDKIGPNSSAIINIHWYQHMTRCCDHEATREHVRKGKEAVLRLLNRSPNVQITIKGPHSVTYQLEMHPGDYIKNYVEQVLAEEFKELQNKVIYLDQWDMTVANENVDVHPPSAVCDTNVHNFMNLVCRNSI